MMNEMKVPAPVEYGWTQCSFGAVKAPCIKIPTQAGTILINVNQDMTLAPRSLASPVTD